MLLLGSTCWVVHVIAIMCCEAIVNKTNFNCPSFTLISSVTLCDKVQYKHKMYVVDVCLARSHISRIRAQFSSVFISLVAFSVSNKSQTIATEQCTKTDNVLSQCSQVSILFKL